jgi:hypothetical protein
VCRYELETEWVPEPNHALRARLGEILRRTACGKFLKLRPLQRHRDKCVKCIAQKLQEISTENLALKKHMKTLHKQATESSELVNLLYMVNTLHDVSSSDEEDVEHA